MKIRALYDTWEKLINDAVMSKSENMSPIIIDMILEDALIVGEEYVEIVTKWQNTQIERK